MGTKPFRCMSNEEFLQWITVPLELLPVACDEPYRFLRDIVALPTTATNPFFTDYDKLNACFGKGLINPFNEETNSFDDAWRCGYSDTFWRYIHIDLAKVHDAATMCMVHAPESVEITREGIKTTQPIVHVDCMVRVLPPAVGEIPFQLFIDLIDDLVNRGFNIRLITFDRHQSTMPIQILRDKGHICEVMSIDRTEYTVKVDRSCAPFRVKHESTKKDYAHAYRTLKTFISEHRLFMPYNEQFLEEAKSLEEDPSGLVYVPPKFPDDVIQAIAGAVTNLWHNEKWLEVLNELLPTVEVLEQVNREKQFKFNMSYDRDGFIDFERDRR